MIKKIISVLLVVSLLIIPLAVPSYAAGDDEVTLEQIKSAMDKIAASTEKIQELTAAKDVSSAFKDFMQVAGYAGTALSVINGSITFMKLIGVIEDPIKGGVENILEQMTTVNEKLSEMDTKLDKLSDAMTTMQATAEFYNRGDKAQHMRTAWNTFQHNYMVDGLDPLIAEYQGALTDNITAWYANLSPSDRNNGKVDNTQLTVIYAPDSEGNDQALMFSSNGIPSQYNTGYRYVTLKSDVFPASLTYNADTYREDLVTALANNIKSALNGNNYSYFESNDFPMFTSDGKSQITDTAINAVAADAVNLLFYRLGCIAVNKTAAFPIKVDNAFKNYCTFLFATDDGIDAILKSFYLTHSFEFETKDAMNDFLNRIMLKTGTYGAFVTSVLGMSDTTTSSVKVACMKRYCDAVENLQSAILKCITGNNKYSYITNSELRYTDITFDVSATVNTEHIYNDKENYKSYQCTKITPKISNVENVKYSHIGDVNTLLLAYTLQNNGINEVHTYLNKNVTKYYVKDYGNIVASIGSEQDMPLDGKVSMRCFNIIGNDFENVKEYSLTSDQSKYPDDAKPKYIYNNKKICGSVYNTQTKAITSNSVLQAVAVYGQTHWNWFFDEAAIFCGPADYSHLNTYMSSSHDKFDYTDTVHAEAKYNTVVSIPLTQKLYSDGLYNPLSSYTTLLEELNKPKPESSPDTGNSALPYAVTAVTVLSILVLYYERKKRYI